MLNKNVLDLTKWDLELSKQINDIAVKLRPLYIEFLTALGQKYENDIDWWVSQTASRNPYTSNIFVYYCYMHLIRHLLIEGRQIDKIIVDSVHLKTALLKAEFIKSEIEILVNQPLLMKIKTWFKSSLILNWFNTLKLIALPLVHAKVFKRLSTGKVKNNLILIDTFLMEGSSVEEHFYPNLFTYCSQSEKDRIVFLPTYHNIKSYKKTFLRIRNSMLTVLLKEDYLRLSDYFYALTYWVRVVRKFNFKDVYLNEFKFDKIVNAEIKRNSNAYTTIEALLKYRLAKRLKEHGFQFTLIINWFENQAVDHGFNGGFRKHFPDTPILGYQPFPVPDNYLCAFPTEQERRCKVIPNKVMVMGRGFLDKPKRFCPGLEVKVAPPLRFWWIWKERRLVPDDSCFTVLIALPYLINDAVLLLQMVIDTLPLNKSRYRFWVKPHPTYSSKTFISKYKKTLPEQLVLVEGDANLYIEQANLVITTSSGICLETVSKGISLICVCLTGIIRDYIPNDIKEDIWALCFSNGELLEAFLKYTKIDEGVQKRNKMLGDILRNQYYEPVNHDNVRMFLNLDK